MSVQLGLLDVPGPRPPAAVTDFLAGFIASYAYGENPTAAQRRAAAEAAGVVGTFIAALKAQA